MIRVDNRAAAQAWVEAQRRRSDLALDEARMRRVMLAWMIRMAPVLYPRDTVSN